MNTIIFGVSVRFFSFYSMLLFHTTYRIRLFQLISSVFDKWRSEFIRKNKGHSGKLRKLTDTKLQNWVIWNSLAPLALLKSPHVASTLRHLNNSRQKLNNSRLQYQILSIIIPYFSCLLSICDVAAEISKLRGLRRCNFTWIIRYFRLWMLSLTE